MQTKGQDVEEATLAVLTNDCSLFESYSMRLLVVCWQNAIPKDQRKVLKIEDMGGMNGGKEIWKDEEKEENIATPVKRGDESEELPLLRNRSVKEWTSE